MGKLRPTPSSSSSPTFASHPQSIKRMRPKSSQRQISFSCVNPCGLLTRKSVCGWSGWGIEADKVAPVLSWMQLLIAAENAFPAAPAGFCCWLLMLSQTALERSFSYTPLTWVHFLGTDFFRMTSWNNRSTFPWILGRGGRLSVWSLMPAKHQKLFDG